MPIEVLQAARIVRITPLAPQAQQEVEVQRQEQGL